MALSEQTMCLLLCKVEDVLKHIIDNTWREARMLERFGVFGVIKAQWEHNSRGMFGARGCGGGFGDCYAVGALHGEACPVLNKGEEMVVSGG